MQRKKRTMVPRFRLPYTTEQVYTMLCASCAAEVQSRRREFCADDAYKQHLQDIARWLTGFDSSFGLFLCGNRGNGKTTIIRALQSLVFWLRSDETSSSDDLYLPFRPGFEIISAKELVRLAKTYTSPTRDNRDDVLRYQHLRDIEVLAIDDLGVEPAKSMNYGEFVTAAKDILSYRYDRQFTTLATSNLAPDEIKDYYDERIADRFREMMLIIDFGHEPSFRTASVCSPKQLQRSEDITNATRNSARQQ